MTDTERWYAQIEKEAFSLTWAAKIFSMYLLGKSFQMETDHDNLLLCGNRIVIPSDCRQDILHKLHEGHHQMLPSSRMFGGQTYLMTLTLSYVSVTHVAEISRSLHNRWFLPNYQRDCGRNYVASDPFKLNDISYIVVVDYFSWCMKILKLTITMYLS